jgi:hypothetical protein
MSIIMVELPEGRAEVSGGGGGSNANRRAITIATFHPIRIASDAGRERDTMESNYESTS